ncbi:hypothetical protein ACFPL7_08565 [Dongia soli]|uniref:Uncharacterized protein n=1 Tax=Dongia soli TaxID=600628 RepID=A0ABU5EB25_9PROT|nr:hypothetical protein [Dongia soli]MDY0882999.1 hypothetical protein [Dongia soli]
MFSRRQALKFFGFGSIASAGLFSYGLTSSVLQSRNEALQEALLQSLMDRHHAAEIGKAWAQQYRLGFVPAKLVADRLSQRLRAYGWHENGDMRGLRQSLAAAVRQDFLEGSIVDVRGWQIARTQAELCVLAHLNSKRV